MLKLSEEEKEKIKQWLLDAFQAARAFDGSEFSEEKAYNPLSLFDDFCRVNNYDDEQPNLIEERVANIAFPTHPIDMPKNIDGFLDIASGFYEKLISKKTPETDIWDMLGSGGAVINESDKVFVKTDDGQIQSGISQNPQSYEVKTEPRLAILIAHLRNDGVNGTPIYMDDLSITRGKVSENMMRLHPYNIVQIPRLDMEIAICDQIGETTFVKKGNIDLKFWDYLSKDELKARGDVIDISRHSDKQWWSEISTFLSGNDSPAIKKVNIKQWGNKKEKLDIGLIKQSLLAHYRATGEWFTSTDKAEGGKAGSYRLEHGYYAGKIKASALNIALMIDGARGLEGCSSIANLNEEISLKHGLDFINIHNQDDLGIELIKQSLLAHYRATGEWLKSNDKAEGGLLLHYKA